MKKARLLFLSTLFLIVILLSSCGVTWHNIQSNYTERLEFDSLPETVKSVYLKRKHNLPLDSNQVKAVNKDFFNRNETSSIYVISPLLKVRHFNVSLDATKRILWANGEYFKINKRKVFFPYRIMHAAPFIIDSSYIYFTSPFWQLTNDLKEYYYYRTKYKKNNKGSLNPILPEIKYDNEERNNKPDGEEMKR